MNKIILAIAIVAFGLCLVGTVHASTSSLNVQGVCVDDDLRISQNGAVVSEGNTVQGCGNISVPFSANCTDRIKIDIKDICRDNVGMSNITLSYNGITKSYSQWNYFGNMVTGKQASVFAGTCSVGGNSSNGTPNYYATQIDGTKTLQDLGFCTVCTPNWQTGAWGTCVNGQQTRTVTDSNNCGVTTGKPDTTESCTVACTPNWQTGAWSTCVGGTHYRTVTDSNNCGVTTGMPSTTESCTVACTPSWQTGAWGACVGGQQTRTVTDTNNCGVTTGKPDTTQSCTVACATNSDCGTNAYVGSPFCQNGNVYQNYITYVCNGSGTNSVCSHSTDPKLQTTCLSGQTCRGNACVANQSNIHISCYASPSTVNVGQSVSFICNVSGGNGNYTYSWSGACTGSSAICTTSSLSQGNQTATLLVTSGSQTNSSSASVFVNQNCTQNSYQKCNGNYLYWYDSCGNIGSQSQYCPYGCSGNTCQNYVNNCTSNSYEQCVGSYLYWYNSCGVQQSMVQYCPNGCSGSMCQNYNYNTCTQNSYQKCNGSYLYWYDSCGNMESQSQYCPNGCTFNSCNNVIVNNNLLTVNKTVRDLSNGTGFAGSTSASPSDMLMFMITIQANGGQNVQNVIVRDSLPSNLIYNNQLVVACTNNNSNYSNNCNGNNYSYSGDIISGVNLNTIYAGQTVTITYQVLVAGAQNFSYGSTTLNNSVSVTSSNGNNPTSSASVVVTKTAVLGASYVATGLTNNFWADSFFLPLLITFMLIWMWRSGMFFGIERWMDNKKKIRQGHRTEKELASRIAEIKNSSR